MMEADTKLAHLEISMCEAIDDMNNGVVEPRIVKMRIMGLFEEYAEYRFEEVEEKIGDLIAVNGGKYLYKKDVKNLLSEYKKKTTGKPINR